MRLKHAIALRVFIPAALLLLVTGIVVQSTATDRLTELNEQRYLSSIGILSESVREALLAQDLASLDEQLLALVDSRHSKRFGDRSERHCHFLSGSPPVGQSG